MGFNPVLAMFIGIIVMMALIIWNKLHPFPALIISAILIAVLAMPFGPEGNQVATLAKCVSTVTTGLSGVSRTGFRRIHSVWASSRAAKPSIFRFLFCLVGR